jgi:predicted metal-binding membrane protein
MVVAMMFPLMIIPVRTTAFNSLWRSRHRAIAEFLAGYLGIWTVAGIAWMLVPGVLDRVYPGNADLAAALAFLIAAIWQVMALKRRFLASCHWTMPLAPNGWRAHFDCFYFGANHGAHCAGNCLPLMLAAVTSSWHSEMMVIATLILLYERYRARPEDKILPATIGLLGLWHAAF